MSSRRVLQLLRDYESRNVTFLDPDGSWPVVWKRARGSHVWDEEGRRYTDFTSAFGVVATGHANPRVVRAGQKQMATLGHAMGDVHPHALKAQLARELSRLTFERWTSRGSQPLRRGKTVFSSSGFEAVESALKTARLATGRAGVIAFDGAYHGLGYGALNATHRDLFRVPFQDQLGGFVKFIPFPSAPDFASSNPHPRSVPPLRSSLAGVEGVLAKGRVGAVLIEPIQGRGGLRIPAEGFLAALRRLCDAHGALLVFDEIYTGLGRTGGWFACEQERVTPDLLCLGKALTGGFPLSAMVGRADVMDRAWPESRGEAMHTSTFLGHPVGCAMALAQITELRVRRYVPRARRLGLRLMESLARGLCGAQGFSWAVRGRGLMVGVEVWEQDGTPGTDRAVRCMKAMLERGFLVLPEGEHSQVVSLAPPLMISEGDLARVVPALKESLS